MSLLASETHAKVAAVQNSLQQVEKHLAPLLSKSSKEVSRQLEALENAELQVSLAYAAASLYFCHLLSQGVDPSDHPIRQELDRIQLYFKKVRTAAEGAAEKELAKDRLRVDADAAKRIVRHYTHAAEAAAQRRSDEAMQAMLQMEVPQPSEATQGAQRAHAASVAQAAQPSQAKPKKVLRKKVKTKAKAKPKPDPGPA